MTDFLDALTEDQIPNIANKRAGEYFRVEISYSLALWERNYITDYQLETLAKEFGGSNTGSGGGFGARDLTMEFYTHIEALAFIDVMSRIMPRVTVESLSFNSEYGFGYLPL